MSLEYYLFTKKKYEEILFHLDEIIEIQQQLNVKEFRDPIFELEKNTHFFITAISNTDSCLPQHSTIVELLKL